MQTNGPDPLGSDLSRLPWLRCKTESVTTPPVVELIRSPELSDRAPYAYAAAVHDASRLIFTAGACPLDGRGTIVAVGDVTRQTEQVMANLATALEAAGAGLTDVVKTTVYVASHQREDLLAAWSVVSAAFGDHDVPSTLLAAPSWL
jgi:enamine deaminase RidA (YjgF/YER057c/UK114 family)